MTTKQRNQIIKLQKRFKKLNRQTVGIQEVKTRQNIVDTLIAIITILSKDITDIKHICSH